MRVVDLAERPPGPHRLGHRRQRVPCRLEHGTLSMVALADGDGPHQACAIVTIARGELERKLVDGVEMAVAGRAADEKRPIARTQDRARRWRIAPPSRMTFAPAAAILPSKALGRAVDSIAT